MGKTLYADVDGSIFDDVIGLGFTDGNGDMVTNNGENIFGYGGTGDDELFGDAGNDKLLVGQGNDTLIGGSGNDSLYGNKGNNELRGGSGNDFISTGDQTSEAFGGSGTDTFEVRMKKGGDHELTGGGGADEFQFIQAGSSATSDMTITDFALDLDTFSIDGVADGTYLSLIGAGAVTEVAGNTVVNLSTGDSITFEGISETTFEAFYFGVA